MAPLAFSSSIISHSFLSHSVTLPQLKNSCGRKKYEAPFSHSTHLTDASYNAIMGITNWRSRITTSLPTGTTTIPAATQKPEVCVERLVAVITFLAVCSGALTYLPTSNLPSCKNSIVADQSKRKKIHKLTPNNKFLPTVTKHHQAHL